MRSSAAHRAESEYFLTFPLSAPFEFIYFCSAAGRDLRQDERLLLNSLGLVPLLVRICVEMDDTSFEFI